MTTRSALLEKESITFTTTKKRGAQPSSSNYGQTAVISAKRPDMDEFLEDTLLYSKIGKSLTKRELEILGLIVAGNTNKKIAKKLYRTERTVEYHRNRLMRKLGAHGAADLVRRAITMGII